MPETANIDDLCSAIANQLNGEIWSPAFTAVVDDTPYYSTDEISTLRVTILPFGFAWETDTRSRDKLLHTIELSLQQKAGAVPSPPTVDPLIALSKNLRRLERDVSKYLRNPTNRTPPTYPTASLLGLSGRKDLEFRPLYSSGLLQDQRTFVGVMHLSYVEFVEH